MKKKILLVVLIIVLVGGYFGYQYVMAPPKDISSSTADFKNNALNFALEFEKNETIATSKYTEKVIQVKGTITGVENNNITLDNKVNCGFENNINLKKGDQVIVKGLFIGFDEMFEEVKLDKCSLVK